VLGWKKSTGRQEMHNKAVMHFSFAALTTNAPVTAGVKSLCEYKIVFSGKPIGNEREDNTL